MSEPKIVALIAVMINHSIEYRLQDGQLFVLDYTLWGDGMHVQWVEATQWTVADAKRWLGY